MKGILAVSDVPLVSRDFALTDVSTTIDSSLTMVMVRSCPAALILAHAERCISSSVIKFLWPGNVYNGCATAEERGHVPDLCLAASAASQPRAWQLLAWPLSDDCSI